MRASGGGGSGGRGGTGGSGGISGSPSNADSSERKVATWSGLRQRSSVVSLFFVSRAVEDEVDRVGGGVTFGA